MLWVHRACDPSSGRGGKEICSVCKEDWPCGQAGEWTEPPADITSLVAGDVSEPVLDDPPLAVRVALKTTAYVTVIALLACVAVAALGLLIRIVAWALGFSS